MADLGDWLSALGVLALFGVIGWARERFFGRGSGDGSGGSEPGGDDGDGGGGGDGD